ncbi:hypothetical protein, partial [Acidianus sp. RZ1]
YISPFINDKIYIYIDGRDIFLEFTYSEFLRMMHSIKLQQLKILKKETRYTELGIVTDTLFEGSIKIVTLLDWGVQNVLVTIDEQKPVIEYGPYCDYENCSYFALALQRGELLYYKVRINENEMDSTLYSSTPLNLVNELIFYALYQKLKLF